MVMHYGGFACDMDRIMEIGSQHGIKIIEDACHGPLSEYSPRGIKKDLAQSVSNNHDDIPRGKGKKLGTIGDVGCFSFFSNKNISTGEGGMLVTNNADYAARTKLLRSHGMTSMSYERAKGHSTAYDVVDLGYNYRMDDIRASIGLVQLDKIEEDLKLRAEIRKLYIKHLDKLDRIIIPFKKYTDFSSNYIFPIVLKDSTFEKRDSIREQLAEAGIQTSVHYPAVHHFSIYKAFYTELPVTDYLVDNFITLPMYSKLTNEQILYGCNSLKGIL